MRGSIVDVFPATAEHPVRIDLWGDEVERLSHFSVADQRSTHEIDDVTIFPCRELLPTDEVRARAQRAAHRRAVGAGAVGAARRRPGLRRHGVVAAVAHGRRPPAARPPAGGRSGAARRAAAHARPCAGAARRRGGAGGGARGNVGRGRRRVPAPLAAVRPAARPHATWPRRRCWARRTRPTPRSWAPRRSTRSWATSRPWPSGSARCSGAITGWCSPPRARVRRSASRRCWSAKGSTLGWVHPSRRARSPCSSRRSSAASSLPARIWRWSPRPTSPAGGGCTAPAAARARRSTTTTI